MSTHRQLPTTTEPRGMTYADYMRVIACESVDDDDLRVFAHTDDVPAIVARIGERILLDNELSV